MPTTFDYFIVGTGPTGQSFAQEAAKAGHRVGITDSRAYGGTCPLRGCDPKKVLLAAAQAMNAVDLLKGKGFEARPPFNWADLQAWKREFTTPIPENSREKLEEAGIHCFDGQASFTAPHQLRVGEEDIRADNVVLATGARPAPLDFPGADLLLTSEGFLDQDELPAEIVIVGGGYIGAEFAHIACVLGSKVIVIASEDRPVSKFDDDLNGLLANAARERGMMLHFNSKASRVEDIGEGRVRVHFTDADDNETTVEADRAFHAAGRVPNLEALELDRAGIDHGKQGIAVDSSLCTSVRAHYAIGDCADSGLPLTPVGTHEASLLADNLLHGKSRTIDYFPVPTLAFTIPPIASVGMTADEAADSDRNLHINYEETTDWFHTRHQNGIVSAHKLIIDTDEDVLLGAHLLGPGADEMINLLTLAIHQRIPLEALRKMVWAYPTGSSNIGGMVKVE